MFNIKTDTIRERTTNGPTYMKGRQYYKHGHVKHIAYDQKNNLIVAQVEGSRMYTIRIILNNKGELHDATCTCSAFSAYWGYCRHITAALLYCIDLFDKEGQLKSDHLAKSSKSSNALLAESSMNRKQEKFKSESDQMQQLRRNRSKTRDFLGRLQHACQLNQSDNKDPVALRVVLFCPRSTSGTPWFSMAAGTDNKLYPVTNVEQLAESISRDLPVELDQRFTYDPSIYCFKDQDLPLINMIKDAFENDYKAVFGSASSGNRDRCFPLNPSRLAAFLRFSDQLSDCTWLSHTDEPRTTISMKEAPLPIQLQLTHEPSERQPDLPSYRLQLICDHTIQQITASRNIYLVGEVFYLPPSGHIRFLEPILTTFSKPNVKKLHMNHEEAVTFLSSIRPFLDQICPLMIDPTINQRMIEEPVVCHVNLDYASDAGLKASIEYQYGQHSLDPFQPKEALSESSEAQLIIRDKIKENQLMEALTATGFIQYGQSLRLNDSDSIFDFFDTGLSRIKETADVSMTKEVENVRILPPPVISFQFSRQENQDELTFTQNFGQMKADEWSHFIKALKDNRSYYRRTDGSFQKVTSDQKEMLTDVDHLMQLWQIKPGRGTIKVPAYRALTLNHFCERYLNSDTFMICDHLRELVTNLNRPGALRFRTSHSLADKLRPYQKTGFRWLCTLDYYGLGGILADDMGLGKTIQTIAFIHMIWSKNKRNALIVAPTSLIYNWAAELEKFAPALPFAIIDGNPQQRADVLRNNKQFACLITSYSLLRRDIDEIKTIKFGCCFIDEAQNIKNPDTLNARSVKMVQTERCFALTGTPIENTLTELWSIFDFIMPGYLFSHSHFQKQYEWPISKDGDEEKAENLRQLISPFILRRMKKNVLLELPEKIETRTICDMTEQQRQMYDLFLDRSRSDLSRELNKSGYAKSQIYILALLTRLRQICCHPGLFDRQYNGGSGKLLLLDELLADSFAAGHRVLLFSQFTQMLNIIQNRVIEAGEKPFYIDGQVPADDRLKLVDRFNSGEGRLFLISLRAGGTGLNLTGADTVIHYDPWWNPAVEDQATDRVYRIGQENVVQVIKLFTRHSVEEKIHKLQEKKQFLADTLIKPGQSLLSKMNLSEVMQLFDLSNS